MLYIEHGPPGIFWTYGYIVFCLAPPCVYLAKVCGGVMQSIRARGPLPVHLARKDRDARGREVARGLMKN